MKQRGLREDFIRLMHLPLPFCVLAFATIGAALTDHVYFDRLALTYIGILLPLCLSAYSLDELHGRPNHTQFSDKTLRIFTSVGIAGGAIVAIYLTILVGQWILVLAGLATYFIFAYNLELFSGRFHNAAWFGVSWGGLTTFSGYYVQAASLSASVLLISAMASLFSVGILYLTHKFRPLELSKKLGENIPPSSLRDYSRHTRKVAWTVVKIECYSMVLLALGLIVPKII